MALIDDVYALLPQAGTVIGALIPDVSIRELHQDALAITDHPVEIGAAISDHAFALPKRLEIQAGYSDATGRYVGYSRQQYEAFLRLQAQREPFTVYTTKRRYSNMLLEVITGETDEKTADAAILILRLREVIIVSTRSGGGGSGSGSAAGGGAPTIAPNGDQANPESTGGETRLGMVGVTVVTTDTDAGGTIDGVPVGGAGGGSDLILGFPDTGSPLTVGGSAFSNFAGNGPVGPAPF